MYGKDQKLFSKQLIVYPNKTQDTHVFSRIQTHYRHSNVWLLLAFTRKSFFLVDRFIRLHFVVYFIRTEWKKKKKQQKRQRRTALERRKNNHLSDYIHFHWYMRVTTLNLRRCIIFKRRYRSEIWDRLQYSLVNEWTVETKTLDPNCFCFRVCFLCVHILFCRKLKNRVWYKDQFRSRQK